MQLVSRIANTVVKYPPMLTASYYSQDETSEKLIGEWMELRGNRDQMVIATKVSTFRNFPASLSTTDTWLSVHISLEEER